MMFIHSFMCFVKQLFIVYLLWTIFVTSIEDTVVVLTEPYMPDRVTIELTNKMKRGGDNGCLR